MLPFVADFRFWHRLKFGARSETLYCGAFRRRVGRAYRLKIHDHAVFRVFGAIRKPSARRIGDFEDDEVLHALKDRRESKERKGFFLIFITFFIWRFFARFAVQRASDTRLAVMPLLGEKNASAGILAKWWIYRGAGAGGGRGRGRRAQGAGAGAKKRKISRKFSLQGSKKRRLSLAKHETPAAKVSGNLA